MSNTSEHIVALFSERQDGFVPGDPPLAIGYARLEDDGAVTLLGELQKRDTTPWVRWTTWFELRLGDSQDGKALYSGCGIALPVHSDLLPDPMPQKLHAAIGTTAVTTIRASRAKPPLAPGTTFPQR